MLESTNQVDKAILEGMEAQFRALDMTEDGTVCMNDFPEGMGLRKVIKTFNGTSTTDIEIVPLEKAEVPSQETGVSTEDTAAIARKEAAATEAMEALLKRQNEHKAADAKQDSSAFAKKGMGGSGGASHGKPAVIAFCTVLVYLAIACIYYGSIMRWTITECIYFSMATITTTGYGDYNGSAGPLTMLFTAVFGFIGVGLIGCAVGEVVQILRELQEAAQKKMLEKVASDIAAGAASMSALGMPGTMPQIPFLKQLKTWSEEMVLGRLIRVFSPAIIVGFFGSAILLATEDPDSDIMLSSNPLVTAAYVSIITGLGVGKSSDPLVTAFYAVL
jgi:hypothetical protein